MSVQKTVALLSAVLAFMILFSPASNGTERPNVAQAAVGTCNQNTVTLQTGLPAGKGGTERDNSTFTTAKQPCVVVQISHELNALEHAQLQLLIAEHPTQVSTGPMSFRVRLGESTASIWIEVSNKSSYDIHNVWIEQARGAYGDRYRPAKEQTYLTASLPDAVVTAKSLVMKGGETAMLLAASPSQIAKALSGVPRDWCLYDLGDRASDFESVGFQEAWAMEAERGVANPEPQSMQSGARSIGAVFTVRYMDIFDLPHEITRSVYLRVASPDTKTVFYPSRKAYGPLECSNHESF